MSRVDQAIRRYEEEIQNICRSNAELRASIQSKASPQRSIDFSDSQRYVSSDVRRLQQRVQTLEDYVATLEEKLRNPPGARLERDNQSEEISALRKTATALSEENEALRSEINSLKFTGQRPQVDHSQCQNRELKLQEAVANLRAELARERQEKLQLSSRNSALQEQVFSTAELDAQPSKSEEELSRYKALATERGEEKAKAEKRLQDFILESEDMQEDLKRRILVLESRQKDRNYEEKTAAASKSRRAKREVSSHARESRSKSATRTRARQSSTSDYADVVHYSCPKCIRKHSKERLRKSISP